MGCRRRGWWRREKPTNVSERRIVSKIACLGWGSLVWNHGGLRVRTPWKNDGPLIYVEFARESLDGRITLVLTKTDDLLTSCWAFMDVDDLAAAIQSLLKREGIRPENESKHIGVWPTGQTNPPLLPNLAEWAAVQNVDHVIWTNLPPKFKGNEIAPSIEQILEYLASLVGAKRQLAEEYIRRAPTQIDTSYRRHIEARFGWTSKI